jgi:excinuclease ABC subunit C
LETAALVADDDPDRPGIDPTTGKPRKFAYPPQLVVVDGGEPQVNAAAQVLAELGVSDVTLCGLAKRLEEVWLPAEAYPLILPRASEGLYLLQRARDEAHRFAITFHRERRSKRMTASTLDGIVGLGETRRKALLAHFGSLKKLGAASVEEIATVPGIGRRTAEAVMAALRPEPATAGADRTAPGSAPVDAAVLGSETGEAAAPEPADTVALGSETGEAAAPEPADTAALGSERARAAAPGSATTEAVVLGSATIGTGATDDAEADDAAAGLPAVAGPEEGATSGQGAGQAVAAGGEGSGPGW